MGTATQTSSPTSKRFTLEPISVITPVQSRPKITGRSELDCYKRQMKNTVFTKFLSITYHIDAVQYSSENSSIPITNLYIYSLNRSCFHIYKNIVFLTFIWCNCVFYNSNRLENKVKYYTERVSMEELPLHLGNDYIVLLACNVKLVPFSSMLNQPPVQQFHQL